MSLALMRNVSCSRHGIAARSACAVPALAANADALQANVDKRNDAGNSIGNDKVDTLNRGQLYANQKPAAGRRRNGVPASAAARQPAGPEVAADGPAGEGMAPCSVRHSRTHALAAAGRGWARPSGAAAE